MLQSKFIIPEFSAKAVSNPIKNTALQADTFVRSKANISFTSVDDTKEGRAIRELGGVPCPYTGVPIINGKEVSHLNKKTLSGTAQESVALLKPFEDRMQPVEKQVFGIIETLSKKNPKKNLRQVLDIVRPEHLENIKNIETNVLNKMSEIKINDEKDSDKVFNLLYESKNIIDKQDANYIFRRRRFMEKLDGITSTMKEQDKAQQLKDLAEELPRAHDTVSSFIVKFTQKDPNTKKEKEPWQIGQALVQSSVGSIEHIRCRHPKDGSEPGANNISNYIYASKAANSLRGNMPLPQWIEKHPEVKDNMQKYMDGVIEKINNKQAMKGFRAYPIVVAKTIEKESNGMIKLDTSKLKVSKQEVNEALIRYGLKESSIRASRKSQEYIPGKFSLVA
ncbi:hypothetical protein IJ818_04620 [bacterium]|nr:hypothetical protein [bacterium]